MVTKCTGQEVKIQLLIAPFFLHLHLVEVCHSLPTAPFCSKCVILMLQLHLVEECVTVYSFVWLKSASLSFYCLKSYIWMKCALISSYSFIWLKSVLFSVYIFIWSKSVLFSVYIFIRLKSVLFSVYIFIRLKFVLFSFYIFSWLKCVLLVPTAFPLSAECTRWLGIVWLVSEICLRSRNRITCRAGKTAVNRSEFK